MPFTYTFQQSKSAAGTGTAPTFTWTTTPVMGDLLVVGVYSVIATALTMSSAGWTALTSSTGTTRAVRMFWKVAGASESTTVTATSGNGLWAICGADYDLGRTIPVMSKEGSITYASQNTCNTPTVTPPTGRGTIAVCFSAQSLASAVFSPGPLVVGPPTITGVTSNKRENTASASACNAALYDVIDPNGDNTYTGAAGTVAGTAAIGAAAIATFVRTPLQLNNYRSIRSSTGTSIIEAGAFR